MALATEGGEGGGASGTGVRLLGSGALIDGGGGGGAAGLAATLVAGGGGGDGLGCGADAAATIDGGTGGGAGGLDVLDGAFGTSDSSGGIGENVTVFFRAFLTSWGGGWDGGLAEDGGAYDGGDSESRSSSSKSSLSNALTSPATSSDKAAGLAPRLPSVGCDVPEMLPWWNVTSPSIAARRTSSAWKPIPESCMRLRGSLPILRFVGFPEATILTGALSPSSVVALCIKFVMLACRYSTARSSVDTFRTSASTLF